MTIEFESQGSRLLAVSNLEEAKTHFKDGYEIFGLSQDHPEHHEAMKEAGIYTVNPCGNMPKSIGAVRARRERAQNRTSENWILLRIKE